MNLKKYLSKIAAFSMGLCIISGSFTAHGDTNMNLKVEPNNEGNYVHLEWSPLGSAREYSYMIYSKEFGQLEYQSIPAKETVKVLNIYPGTGNNVKGWMENPNSESSNGYGKGLISVDEVNINNFNSNPEQYLKDSNGNWKYNVVYEGAWDWNNQKDLSAKAEQLIEQFIKSGRGYLCGHDCMLITSSYSATNRNKLASYLNVVISQNASRAQGSTISINKKGLLTNYPWNIGDVGTDLTVPLSHSSGQTMSGDIWMRYTGSTAPNANNFYLATWNNCAMIQTGHSNGAATPDEQKVLANTLFYLSQVTDETSWDDHKGQDLTAPTVPSINSVVYDRASNSINVNYMPSVDNGSKYDYYVEATNLSTKSKTKSETKSATVTSGIKGYSIVVDNNANTSPSGEITTTGTSCNVSLNGVASQDFYVHVAAVDNAGNVSEASHYKYGYPLLTLTPNTTAPASAVKISASATSSNSTIEKIQTPDGNWVNGNTTDYIVRENGSYTFKAMDSNGMTVTQSITISNIDKNAGPVLTLTPDTTEPVYEVKINASATSDSSIVKKIKTPDGNWVEGSSTDYVVDENGTYEFQAVDDYGTTTTNEITISNIKETKVILNIEPKNDDVYLGGSVEAYLTIDNIQQIAAEDVRIKYDSSKLQFLGMVEVPGIKIIRDEANDDELRVILASQGISNVVFMKKNLLRLNFKAIGSGSALIDVTKGRISDGFLMEKDLRSKECGEATVNIQGFMDVNNNGEFTLLDLSIDGRYYGKNPADYPQYNTDIVRNGAIDDDDIVKIGDFMIENSNYLF